MFAIGGAAAAASFTHVHDLAVAHRQGGWLGWADAVVLELMSIAAGLEIRRRRRHQQRLAMPSTVLVCAVGLSLAAQVIQAEPSVIGWIAAAVPALGFLTMVKIALGYHSPLSPEPRSEPTPAGALSPGWPSPSAADRTAPTTTTQVAPTPPAATGRAALTEPGDARSDGSVSPRVAVTEPDRARTIDVTGPTTVVTEPHRAPAEGSEGLPVVTERDRAGDVEDVTALLPAARRAAAGIVDRGDILTRDALADALRAAGYAISSARASTLLKTIKQEATPDERAPTPAS
jgi:hypothetical protein